MERARFFWFFGVLTQIRASPALDTGYIAASLSLWQISLATSETSVKQTVTTEKRVEPPIRFIHADWATAHITKNINSEEEHAAAERLVEESKEGSDEKEKRTEKTQRDVSKRFQQRLDDIRYWKNELDDKLASVTTEIDNLLACKTRVEKALGATHEPWYIARQWLMNRERQGIDLVNDDVQKELIKEVEAIEGVQALLQRSLEQASEHASSDTPEDFSHQNIEKADRERQSSVSLQSLVHRILQQTSNNMHKQDGEVNAAFNKWIAESKDTKSKPEDHLNKIIDQIKKSGENIIQDKEQLMKLAQTRIDTRNQRPNGELSRDPVQYRLVEEVGEIVNTIDELQARLAKAESSLKSLIRNQLSLEH